jgi:MFS family permease
MSTVAAGDRPAIEVRPRVTLGLLSVQHALIHGQSALYPLVFLAIIDEFGVTAGAIAIVAAVGSMASGLLQLAFGDLTRRFTRRGLLGSGGVLLGVMTTAQAFTASFVPFAVANVTSRLGGSPQHPVANALLAEQYPRERWGFAISAHIAGGNVGTVVVGVIAAAVVTTVGWRPAVALLGILAVAVGVAIVVAIRETGVDRAHAVAAGRVRDAYRRVIADADLRWLFLSGTIAGGSRGLGALNVFVPLYLDAVIGLDPATIGAMYAVLLAASVPGPLVAGWLSDRYDRKRLIVIVYLAAAASIAVFVLAGDDIAWLWVGIVLLSLFSFVESPQLQALLADITSSDMRDAAYSTYFALSFGVGAAWALAYGALLEVVGEVPGLTVVFWIMAAASIGAALAILPMRVPTRPASPVTTPSD